jgi:hypothetical protein
MNRANVVIALFAVLFAHQAGAEMREFKLPDGRSLKAEVVGYQAGSGQVELKREDGKRVKVKPAIFVEDDQNYINEWVSLDGFRNKSHFRVDCSKKKVEQWKEEDESFELKFDRYVYEVALENRNSFSIENLTIEYRIFYEQEKNDQSTRKVVNIKHIKPGKLNVKTIHPKEKRKLSTESVVLNEYEFNSTDFYYENGDPESTGGDIKGIWLRLHVTTSTGQKAKREIFEPTSIAGKYSW